MADNFEVSLRSFLETVCTDLNHVVPVVRVCGKVDPSRDAPFLDAIHFILAQNDILEIRHLHNVEKIKCGDGATAGKKVVGTLCSAQVVANHAPIDRPS